ncbi:hypothetical protein BJF78_16485 [Pseudonocardia sp. CNS-139]|nr:hypothetical protein BJF78_16485 [Pseudonocardia sp. CNS-139]
MTLFISSVAGISLLVGGIGIANIMLVTVTERTREIGIRKAIGARRRSILQQFLLEAMMLAGLGGLLGILFGVGVTVAASIVLPQLFSGFPPPSCRRVRAPLVLDQPPDRPRRRWLPGEPRGPAAPHRSLRYQ